MKLSNSAITMLMAAYRAIFKNAYYKGLVGAVVLTTSMGAASAVVAEDKTIADVNKTPNTEFVVSTAINITKADATGTATTEANRAEIKNDIKVNAGGTLTFDNSKAGTGGNDSGDFYIKTAKNISVNGKGATLNFGTQNSANQKKLDFRSTGDLTLSNSGAANVYAYSGANSTTVQVANLNINSGATLKIVNQSAANTGNALVYANQVKVDKGTIELTYNGTSGGDTKKGRSTLGMRHSVHNGDVVRSGTSYTFSNGSTLLLNSNLTVDGKDGRTYGAEVLGKSFTMTDSTLKTNTGGGKIATGDITFNNSYINLAENSAIEFINYSHSVANSATDANVKNGTTFQNINGTTTISGGVVSVGGQLKLTRGGTLVIQDGTKLTTTTAANASDNGLIKIGFDDHTGSSYSTKSFAGTTNPTLKISANTLKDFLSSGENIDVSKWAGKGQTITDAQGALGLYAGGRLEFSDDTVNMNDFSFVQGTASNWDSLKNTAGQIAVFAPKESIGKGEGADDQKEGDIQIIAKNMTIGKSFVTGESDKPNSSSANAKFIAKDTLTLGSDSFTGDKALGVSELQAKNLAIDSTKGFTLQDKLTLSSLGKAVTSGNQTIIPAESGTITGDLIVTGADKGLIIDGGNYTADGTITVDSGALTVKNTGAKYNASTLTTNNLVLDVSQTNHASSITINGGLTGAYNPNDTTNTKNKLTKLDVTNGFSVKVHDSNGAQSLATITVTSGGQLIMTGEDATAAMATVHDSSGLKGVKLVANSGGKLITDGTLEINFANTATAAALNNAVNLKNGGILQTDTLSLKFGSDITKDAGAFDLRGGTLYTNNLTFAHEATDAVSVINAGTFNIANSLSSNKDIKLTKAADVAAAKVTFSKTTSGEGTISTNKLTLESGATATFAQGTWNAANTTFDVASGTLTIGDSADSAATLTAKGLTVGANGTASVNKGGFLTVDALNTVNSTGTDKGLIVNGNVVVNGNTEKTKENLAVKTAADSIQVNANGTLTFGNDAVMNSIYSGSGDENSVKLVEGGFTANSINLAKNGTVELKFTKDNQVQFNEAQLKDLKNKLFGVTDGKIDGVLNVGEAKIADMTFGEDSDGNVTVDIAELNKNQGVVSDVTNTELVNAQVTGVSSSNTIAAHVGSVNSKEQNVNVGGNSSFNNAAGNQGLYAGYKDASGNYVAANVTVNDSTLSLNKGGSIGEVTLSGENASLVTKDGGTTNIAAVSGSTAAFTANADVTKVSGDVNVKNISNAENTTLTIGGKLTAANGATFAGKTQISGAATVTGNLEVSGVADFGSGLKVTSGKATFKGDTTVKGEANIGGNLTVDNNATLQAQTITLGKGQDIKVGSDADEVTGEKGTSGRVIANSIKLNGGTIIADPTFSQKASMVLAGYLDNSTADTAKTAGTLNGSLVAGQNSIIAVGVADEKNGDTALQQMEKYILPYLVDSNGSLEQDGVGAVAFVAKSLVVQNGSEIIADPSVTHSTYNVESYSGAAVYLASGGALLVDEDAFGDQGKSVAIALEGTNQTVTAESGGKIILSGAIENGQTYHIFSGNGLVISGKEGKNNNAIIVESLNGLFNAELSGPDGKTTEMTFNTSRAKDAFVDASAPVRDYLIAYTSRELNWDRKQGEEVEKMHNGVATDVVFNGTTFEWKEQTSNSEKIDQNDYFYVTETTESGSKTVVYRKVNNAFLDRITQNAETKGHDADTASRLGAFGGVAQAALAASSVVSDTIAARLGVGASANVTAATNGASSLWVTPVYKAANSDGFGANDMNYGADVSLYGLALGGDYTLASGLKFGAMFNVGSGDADGNGIGRDVSNDFDFYGFGIYGGFAQGPFSIIGDISYSAVDNDLKGNINGGKLTSSMDSSALSLGVTGQYELNMGTLSVTPHAGLRYTKIDLDDYTVKSDIAGQGEVGKVNNGNVNVFSIPVGVTFAKNIVSGEWTFKPMVDLTVAANFGDDTVDSTMKWTGVAQELKTNSEFIDGFTYGATAGVELSSQSFSLGIGVNYNRSSNTDGYGINANARFVF